MGVQAVQCQAATAPLRAVVVLPGQAGLDEPGRGLLPEVVAQVVVGPAHQVPRPDRRQALALVEQAVQEATVLPAAQAALRMHLVAAQQPAPVLLALVAAALALRLQVAQKLEARAVTERNELKHRIALQAALAAAEAEAHPVMVAQQVPPVREACTEAVEELVAAGRLPRAPGVTAHKASSL